MKRGDVRILIADDDFEIRLILKRRLEREGFTTIAEVDNGEDALTTIMTKELPHVAVIDVMMPRLNGWEVCRYLRDREQFNGIGIIVITAIGPKLNELTTPLYGVTEYLDKPFDLDDFMAMVMRVLTNHCEITLEA